MSQIPVVYLLVSGMRRFAGTLLVIASNVHSIGYIYQWTIDHTFSKNVRMSPHIWAFVALVTVDLICLFSIPFFRRRAYNFFYCSHVVLFVLFLPAIHAHQPGVWPYVIAAAGIISLDYLIRFMKTCVFNARIRPIPDLMLTRIEVPQLNAGWRAGQHVRLRVLSSAMGWFSWAESHPFTIATATKTPEGMVLL
ncbi:hypothetical protein C8R48DRAFT_316285, partial [Suillus tomentosus]